MNSAATCFWNFFSCKASVNCLLQDTQHRDKHKSTAACCTVTSQLDYVPANTLLSTNKAREDIHNQHPCVYPWADRNDSHLRACNHPERKKLPHCTATWQHMRPTHGERILFSVSSLCRS